MRAWRWNTVRTSNRRGRTRHRAGWIARYRTASDDDGWHECKALDVSEAGAALDLVEEVKLGAELVVELHLGDDAPGGVLLLGTVRNSSPTPEGSVRVGVEFEGCTPLDRAVLLRLLAREAALAAAQAGSW
jgi:hypothetical protein